MSSTESKDLALIEIPVGEKALAAFTGDYDMIVGPLVASVRKRIDAFKADAMTEDGRADIKAFAYAIARSKTALEDAGKAVAADLKKLPGKVDANRKRARETLEQWQDEVRAPLTKWETDEKARVDKHVAAIAAIKAQADVTLATTEESLTARVASVSQLAAVNGEEFAQEYEHAKSSALGALRAALKARRAYDADQAELAALRRREAERAAKDKEWEDAERREREAREAEAREAELETLAREKAEADALAARESAERRRVEAKLAAVKAAQEKAAEDARIAAAQADAERVATERKAANKSRQAKINSAIVAKLAGIIAGQIGGNEPVPADIAREIVIAIVKGEVQNVSVNY